MILTRATIEVTKDDHFFRVIPIYLFGINKWQGKRALRKAKKFMSADEYVYSIKAPCKGCDLPQPFYDNFNGFALLKSEIWQKKRLTWLKSFARLFA